MELVSENKELYNSKGINLTGNRNSLFGIYNSYNESILNAKHSLYFSFGLNRFLLYKVVLKNEYVIGKLLNDFSFKNRMLIYKKKEIPFPDSFVYFKKRLFGIKKKEIKIKINDITNYKFKQHYEKYDEFCKIYRNENLFFLKLRCFINKTILSKLYTYLVTRFPLIKADNNYA